MKRLLRIVFVDSLELMAGLLYLVLIWPLEKFYFWLHNDDSRPND